MNPVGKALWFIETELDRELTLDRISADCDMTRFGFSRLFSMNTGWPVMRYVRSRRLTRAARALAQGAPDILHVALDAGYGSHEAFTRAFRDLFGVTPEEVRARRTLDGLSLVEPLRMKELKIIAVTPSRFEAPERQLIAGMSSRYTFETNEGIPALWQAFIPYIGNIPGQVGGVTYGVCCNPDADGSFEYIAGVEVKSRDRLPASFRCVELEPQRYAVFEHSGHISTLHQTFYSIWNGWLPTSGFNAVDAPEFERYSEDYDPVTGTGVLEIWLPVEKSA
ncbi:AraC family transcriptional regulator [Burkholderia sp. MS455]|uniref:AraC family transcriptional regulator n=1 Tax=Burkholderia pyrrocinia TaxID=60550 RepID=A0A318IRZ6_BURPY|nr:MULTISPECIES: AraC family transcriptional regulator [Burkholderia]PXX38115.1 AraC family transcriptional regulator [Burkholderia pyrrocinia]QRR05926.1 AraC family transcriptional regulator [Burkholderia sp. MS455]SFW52861.1 transcriptional regulator, AraC family [Burkholderia sp. NFACC33-1]SFX59560.1 transcriptional regulator, AraC family [Burkholderia sp. NFPP32]